MGIFKAPKAGSQSNELIVGRLTGVMDLKIFYKGKNQGEESRSRSKAQLKSLAEMLGVQSEKNVIVSAVIGSKSEFSLSWF